MYSSLTLARAAFLRAPKTINDSGNPEQSDDKKQPPGPNRWILNAPLDIFFICGGGLWLLLAALLFVDLQSVRLATSVTGIVLVVGTLLFADSHNAATILRFIEEPGLAQKHPFVSELLPILIGAVFIGVLIINPLYLGLALKLYVILLAQHVTAQAYGITMIYLRKEMELGVGQILVIKLAFTSMMVVVIARQFTYGINGSMMGIDIPSWDFLPGKIYMVLSLIAAVTSLAMFVMLVFYGGLSKTRLHPGAVLVGGTTLFVCLAGPLVGLIGLMSAAFFHGTQYIGVSTANAMKVRSLTTRSEASETIISPTLLLTEANFFYWMKLLIIGAILYLAIPWVLSKFGAPPLAALAAVFCAVNFHHFAADSVIWRNQNTKQYNQTPVNS